MNEINGQGKAMLNQKDLVILASKLQLPIIITDILNDKDELTGDMQYALHELISELKPDTALLAIAMSAKEIAANHREASASTKVLELECARIIEEYGVLWLKNARNEEMDPQDIFDVLIHTVEDLESLAELLEASASYLQIKDDQISKLCTILQIQATAHAMIADAFLAAADVKIEEKQACVPDMNVNAIINDNNVIQFPAIQRV